LAGVRVAMVSPYSLSVPGGAQGQVTGLAAALARLGVDVEVLGPGTPAAGGAVFVPLGRAVAVRVNGSQAPVSPYPSTMARAVRRLRHGRFDVVHLHEPFVPGPTLAALAAGPRPIVGTFHRAGVDRAYRMLGMSLGGLRRRLTTAVAVSDEARRTLQAVLGRRTGAVEVLWNGVDVDRFAAAAPEPSDRPSIFFTGRHEPRKGLAVLLEAFTLLPGDVELWVCGTGPDTEALMARYTADHRIVWLGRLGDSEMASRLAGASVFAAPSLGGESFGLVLAEAMAAGTPVVASDLPGYRAALAGAGEVVPPGDPSALAEALRRLLGSATRRAELVDAGHRRAAELAMDRLAERYLDIYRAAITR
jgi:phosphatidylinositol alpha-mannosyltransferase